MCVCAFVWHAETVLQWTKYSTPDIMGYCLEHMVRNIGATVVNDFLLQKGAVNMTIKFFFQCIEHMVRNSYQ